MLARAVLSFALFGSAAMAFPAAIGDIENGGGSAIPELKRGAALDVPCPHVERAGADAVQVVLYPGRDDTTSGVSGVLVTDRTVAAGVVHVTMPDIPDLKDHIVRVKVYVLEAAGKRACDAGRVRLL